MFLKEVEEMSTLCLFSPDGKFIFAVGWSSVALWDLSGNQLQLLIGERRMSTAFSPDGKSVVIGGEKTVNLFTELFYNYFTEDKLVDFHYEECQLYGFPFDYKQVKKTTVI